MSRWMKEELRCVCNGRWVIEPNDDAFDFVGAAIDTRALIDGQVFFVFVGEQVDGHAYLQRAVEAGAAMCVVTNEGSVPDDFGVPVLLVDDATVAITAMADAWRKKIKATVIAITGSNGKTTTCRLVHALCAQHGMSSVSQKSFNNQLGVPITILNTPADAEYLIAELGTSSPGEIAARSALISPDIAVITSIGSAHLEELGDRAGVANEKAAIVHALSDGGTAVIQGGVVELEDAIGPIAKNRTIVRVDSNRVIITESTSQHTEFTLDGVPFTVPMLGIHNAMNASMAIEVGRVLGFDDDSIRTGLKRVQLPEMRFERIEIPTMGEPIVVYNDAYNANPDSMRAALSTFDAIKSDLPKIAILGDMLELGDQGAAEHAAIVKELDQHRSIDRFILVGRLFAQTTADSGRSTRIESTDLNAMTRAADLIPPGSSVLIKGSRGIELERIVHILLEQRSEQRAGHHQP